MSQAKVVGGAITIVVGILAFAVGSVIRGRQDEKDKEKYVNENEELRRQLRSVLEVFKKTTEKKDSELAQYKTEIERLKWGIVELINAPPETLSALRERLHQLGLSTKLVDVLAPIYRGQE